MTTKIFIRVLNEKADIKLYLHYLQKKTATKTGQQLENLGADS